MIWDRTNRPVWLRCTVGILAAVLAAAVRLQFLEILEFRAVFLTFYPAVAVAALYGGFGAGLLATVVSAALANYFWMEPVGQFGITNSADLLSLAVFLASGALISYMAEATFRAQARAHKAEEQSKLSAERETAAVALQKSETRYRELVQNANSAIIRWKRDGTIAFFNEYAQKFFGYTAEEVIGRSVNILMPEQESTGGDLTGLLQDIVNHPDRYVNNINENILRNGSRVWMAWTNRPVFDEDGQVLEILAVGSDITGRKRVEEELRINQSRLDLALRSAHMGVWHLDMVENRRFFDDQVCHLLGIDPAQFTGTEEEFFKAVHPDDREMLNVVWARTVERNVPYEAEYRVVWPDGSIHYVTARGKFVQDDKGLPVRVNGLIWDITERRRAEALLQRQAELLHLSYDAIIVWQLGGPIESWNKGAEELYGYSQEEAVGRVTHDLLKTIHPVPWPQIEATLRERKFWERELKHCTREGREVIISARHQLVRGADGVERVLEINRDITEHKRAEETLRESEDRFRALVQASSDVVYRMSPDWDQMHYLSGRDFISDTETTSNTWLQKYIPPDDQPLVTATINEAIRNKSIFELEHRILRVDGSIGWTFSRAIPLLDQNGEIVEWFGAASNITERKQMEVELRNSRDELELRVRERTAELKSYMARLEQSNQALQDFASIAAHDLKEPLRKVTSFGIMLRQKYEDSLGQTGNDYLDRMLNATERMQSLLAALLDYSRVATASEPFKEVDLSDLIGEVLSDLEVRIVKTGGEVHFETLPVISADPTQMRQLFQNLIGNALKFHKPDGKPIVQVRSVSTTDAECRIVVEDNGIGFEEQYLEKIFAPFQKLHGRREFEGTGLGLAICRKIVERHGGSITAGSTPGVGSKFVVTLPVRSRRD